MWDGNWPGFLSELREIERQCKQFPAPPGDAELVGYMPYDLSRFAMFLTDAVTFTPGPRFLDIGAGPGTKVALAARLYGLEAAGLEIVPEYCEVAARLGAPMMQDDARLYYGYGRWDIVYLNRPVQKHAFEAKLMAAMRPGAVLITVNGMTSPAGWEPISEEWEDGAAVHGVWRKPQAS